MKKTGITSLCLALLMSAMLIPAACTGQPDENGTDGTDQPTEQQVTVTHTRDVLLEGTSWETAVHTYVTDKQGPKIAIVGGIHGDELAGWTTALELVGDFNEDLPGICGEILLIPQANILADTLEDRYPGRKGAVSGVGTVDGVKYSDLNRSFPNGRASNATEATITISDAIRAAVESFDPDYIIDLHESRHSWTEQDTTSTSLGDTLIFKNEALFMDDLLYYYNQVYLEEGETQFTSNPASTKGSFNYYFSNLYPDKVVFTIETNRGYVSGQNTIALSVRVRQQHNILNALFDIVWDRVDTTPILGY